MNRTLTFRTAVSAGLVVALVSAFFYFMLQETIAANGAERDGRVAQDRIAALIEVDKLTTDIETTLRGFMVSRDERYLNSTRRSLEALPGAQRRLAALAGSDPFAAALVRHLNTENDRHMRHHRVPLIVLVRSRPLSHSELVRETAHGKHYLDHVHGHFAVALDHDRRAVAEARRHADQLSERATLLGGLGTAGSILILVLFSGYVLRSVLRPVRRVADAAQGIAAGDLSTRVSESGRGEASELGRSFNAMADSLERTRDELESQNAQLEAKQIELQGAVDELADQAALHRAVLDTAADAFVSVDENDAITAWNPAAERMFGWTAAEAIGTRVRDAQLSVDALAAIAAAPAASDGAVSVHCDARHRDGREFPVEIVISPLERRGKRTYNAFVRDITERRRAELYMRAQLAVTRVLSEARTLADARSGILEALGKVLDWQVGVAWVVDDDAGVLCPTSIWAADDVEGSEFLELTMLSTFRRGEPLPGTVWETGEAQWIEDITLEDQYRRTTAAVGAGLRSWLSFPITSGSRFLGVVEFFSRECERPDPELLSLFGTVAAQIGHFSHRKRAELEADRLKDEFFALVSHELRTPLTSITGYLDLVLEEGEGLDPQSTRFLQVVERNSRRLQRLVGDLLFVAQVEAGRLSLDTDAVMLGGVVADCVEAARPLAEENGVTLRPRVDSVATLQADGDRIGQMLDNLVSNAVKFTPEGGTVDVCLTSEAGRAVVEVRDSGIGIPVDEQNRLFQRFFRSSTATERAIPGVGLGLTISRAIVEAHGGTIRFDSEEGRGTTFRVELPLDDSRRSTPDRNESPREVVL